MTHEPLPFDLKLAREAFATAAQLHGAAARRAAARLTEGDFERMAAHDADFAAALAAGRIHDAIAADDAFHRILLDVAADPDLAVSVELLLPRLRRLDLWHFSRKALEGEPNTHPETIAALLTGDAELAATLVQESFTSAGEALAAAIERTEPA